MSFVSVSCLPVSGGILLPNYSVAAFVASEDEEVVGVGSVAAMEF